MDKGEHDKAWAEYWMSGGFVYESETPEAVARRRHELEAELVHRLTAVHKGQNRLLRKVAEAVDEAWPPDQILPGNVAPGDIVRGFIVVPAEEAKRDAKAATGDT